MGVTMTEYLINTLLFILIIFLLIGSIIAVRNYFSFRKTYKEFKLKQHRFNEEFENNKNKTKSSFKL
mgnify:FL=1